MPTKPRLRGPPKTICLLRYEDVKWVCGESSLRRPLDVFLFIFTWLCADDGGVVAETASQASVQHSDEWNAL